MFVLPSEIICIVSRRVQRSQKCSREKLLTSREILNRTFGRPGKVGETNFSQGLIQCIVNSRLELELETTVAGSQ